MRLWINSCAGLDYVGHEDVLPYKTTQKQPIFNHLFDKFLVASDTTAGTLDAGVVIVVVVVVVVAIIVHYHTPQWSRLIE